MIFISFTTLYLKKNCFTSCYTRCSKQFNNFQEYKFDLNLTDLNKHQPFRIYQKLLVSYSLEYFPYYQRYSIGLRKYLRVAIMVDTAELRSPWLSRSGLHRHCVSIGPGLGSEWWCWEGPLTEIACQQNGLDIEDSEETLAGIKELVKAHLQAPRQQRAPARFFALLHTWKHLHVTWSEEVEQKLNSLEAGVGKLKEAGEQVAKLEDEVSKQRQELEVYVNMLQVELHEDVNDVWDTDF